MESGGSNRVASRCVFAWTLPHFSWISCDPSETLRQALRAMDVLAQDRWQAPREPESLKIDKHQTSWFDVMQFCSHLDLFWLLASSFQRRRSVSKLDPFHQYSDDRFSSWSISSVAWKDTRLGMWFRFEMLLCCMARCPRLQNMSHSLLISSLFWMLFKLTKKSCV